MKPYDDERVYYLYNPLIMNKDRYVFSQITDFIPYYEFSAFVKKYHGDKRIRRLTCRDQFLSLMFGQLTGLRSLRGISLCLNAHKDRLYHLGFRSKGSLSFQRIYSHRIDKNMGLRCDQTIRLKHFYARKRYPGKLRRIKYYDSVTDTHYVYLTNNFDISARTVADLYRYRWQIELFFKWMKQHLKIQVFWGYSFNEVKTQICIAISTFLLVAIMKKELKIERDLYEILQILSVSQFEKTALTNLLDNTTL